MKAIAKLVLLGVAALLVTGCEFGISFPGGPYVGF